MLAGLSSGGEIGYTAMRGPESLDDTERGAKVGRDDFFRLGWPFHLTRAEVGDRWKLDGDFSSNGAGTIQEGA